MWFVYLLFVAMIVVTVWQLVKIGIQKKIQDTVEEAGRKLNLQQSGIGCNNPDCNHIEYNVSFEDFESYIDKPCPQCGTPLMTQEEFDMAQQMHKAMGAISNLTPEQQSAIIERGDFMSLLQMPVFDNIPADQKNMMADFLKGLTGQDPFNGSAGYVSTKDEMKVRSAVQDHSQPYRLTRDVNVEECDWLEEDVVYGSIVYRYFGDTNDEISETGCAFTTEPNELPFFELPLDSVEPVALEDIEENE